jgi:Putative Ig domain
MLRWHSMFLVASLAVVALLLVGCGCNSSSTTLTLSGSFPATGALTVAYGPATLSVSGGTAPYTWTANGLPPGITVSGTPSTTLTISGTPTTVGAYNVSVTVSDANGHSGTYTVTITITASTVTACAPGGNEAALTSATPYAFLVQGSIGDFVDGVSGVAIAGSFTPKGDGTITAAAADYNGENLDVGQSLVVNVAASSYSLGSDGRGCLYLVFSGLVADRIPVKTKAGAVHFRPAQPKASATRFKNSAAKHQRRRALNAHPEQSSTQLPNLTLHFALGNQDGDHVYHTGRIMEFDSTADGGQITAGLMHLQDPSAFNLNQFQTNYAFGIQGWGEEEDADFRIAIAGTFANATGVQTAGFADVNAGGEIFSGLTTGSGSINGTISGSGRTTGTYTIPLGGENGTLVYDYTIFIVDASDFFMVTTDSVSEVPLLSGRALGTAPAFGAAPLVGYYLQATSGYDTVNFFDTIANIVDIGTLHATATGSLPSLTIYENDGGDTDTTTFTNGTYATTTNGRTTLSFDGIDSPPVIYLTTGGGPGENITGFMVGSDDFASAGVLVSLETTTAPNYTMANITGSPYAVGSTEDVVGDVGSLVGTLTFSGTGGSGTFTDLLDSCALGSSCTAGQTGGSSVTINADGSGSFTFPGANNAAFVTNGSQIYAIDFNDESDPLLYVFDEGVFPE